MCARDAAEGGIVWVRHEGMNHMPTIRRVLCAIVLEQYATSLLCLHKHYFLRRKYVNANTSRDLKADQSEIKESPPLRGRDLLAGVFNVFAGPLQGVVCFHSGVGIGFQEIDGSMQAHGLAAGHIPFQAGEVDLQGVADAEGGDALGESVESRACVLQVSSLRQDSLNL